MRVLVVKLSSLGDVIHTLPALGDAAAALPGLVFDWVVEEAFAEIPAWHSAVDRVIPVAIRRWRKRPLREFTGPEWRAARRSLQEQDYDAVIDAQGLLKSAVVARLVPASRYGMDRASAREPLAALAYDHPIHVPRDMHAVERSRLLFARALDYPLPGVLGEYGLDAAVPATAGDLPRGLLFFHGTARAEKQWPETHWIALAMLAREAGYRVWLPWGNDEELQRAQRIANSGSNIEVLPRMDLQQLGGLLQRVEGAVAIDTGLGHLAAALAVPTVSLYGPTRTSLVGAYGRNQVHLQSPLVDGDITDPATLMQAITAGAVWQALVAAMGEAA
ncbi:MAG: lipopolysaccharide heptosyltransferase I [Halieaceae bacterium]|nr:lipopolysaccharide heptosyltransferase I [Halieaceae bacterium]